MGLWSNGAVNTAVRSHGRPATPTEMEFQHRWNYAHQLCYLPERRAARTCGSAGHRDRSLAVVSRRGGSSREPPLKTWGAVQSTPDCRLRHECRVSVNLTDCGKARKIPYLLFERAVGGMTKLHFSKTCQVSLQPGRCPADAVLADHQCPGWLRTRDRKSLR
jgi:hypothetical protein